MKTLILILTTCFALYAFAEESMEQTLVEYCNTSTYSVQHEVMIDDVVGLGHHRNGFLLVSQESDDPDIAVYLLSLSEELGLPNKCLEYLNGKQLLTIDQDGIPASLLARIYFDFDRASLTPASKTILSRVAERLRQSPRIISLDGHTDSVGSLQYNYALGLRRANSAAIYLKKAGVNGPQLHIESYGETHPIATNSSEQGRQLNRRVDIK